MSQIDSSSLPPIGGVYRCTMPVRWGDLDALNHVNNAVYFRYFEEARVQLMARAGIVLPSAAKVCVLAHASCDFLKPLLYPAVAVVSQILRRVGRSSLEMDLILERNDEPGVIYARGRYVVVAIDSATGKSAAWDAQELAQLAGALVAESFTNTE